jgi:ribosomal protein S12 methylthiotransferase accessory factor
VLAAALARTGIPWAPLLVFGGSGFVGPLFVPGEGPCYECLRTRERASWADPELTELYYETVARRPQADAPGASPAEAALVAAWGVVEATKYLAGFVMPAILGAFVHVELLAGCARMRRVHRVPRCPSCSPLVRRPPVDGRLLGGAP